MASPQIFLWILASAPLVVPKESICLSLCSSGCTLQREGVPGQCGTRPQGWVPASSRTPPQVGCLPHIGVAGRLPPSFKAAGPHSTGDGNLQVSQGHLPPKEQGVSQALRGADLPDHPWYLIMLKTQGLGPDKGHLQPTQWLSLTITGAQKSQLLKHTAFLRTSNTGF